MPEASVRRDGELLRLSGALDVGGVQGLSLDRLDTRGVQTIALDRVQALDSTGVALIAELVARCSTDARRVLIQGEVDGLADFCQAYRIRPDFSDFP